MRLYQTPEEKIRVVGEGYIANLQPTTYNLQPIPYILFIGRIEERKNVARIIEAFEMLKEKYQRNEQLILVGKPGYGYEAIKIKMQNSKWKNEIQEKGYVTEEEKQILLQNASVFVFPSLYEGFGLPVLEAQALGVPVVTSSTSSLPEVGGEGALYVDPLSALSIAEGLQKALTLDEEEKAVLHEKMQENLKRFSWEKCTQEIANIL